MSAVSGKATSTVEAPRQAGTDLLLRKLPLLAKAQALGEQHPYDPQAECNLLCYGPDVYRIHSIARRRDDRGPLQSRRRGRLGEDEDEEKRRLSEMDAVVALPTHMPFLAVMESELRKSMDSLQDADGRKPGVEGETANAGTARSAANSTGDRKRKKRHGASWEPQRKGSRASDEEEPDADDGGADEGAKGLFGATGAGAEAALGGEEDALLRAIREPRAAVRAGDTATPAGAVGFSNSTNVTRNGAARGGVGGVRLPWEHMLSSIMSHYGAADDVKGGDAVQSYLRRVAWIEQQKKLQPGLGAAAEMLHRNEQPWVSMTDAMRVQKEMQRVRLQRKRFRRSHKPKAE
ncbi:uncharacterized protein Tco025E_09057 [Trypanosoma conorhini]|uniref:Uncharacterized protein n=1 Tax=Trypanosoma conorhini TaxID=83891 RepID=A0A3R7K229_9TRYP|nr:uncharacterized protein Tco025E_09057 [Trypanosoma conorhini]RNE99209.1 hypothetical protein Tco025E_09057 [Trypanosoma conorhini]